MRNKKNGYVYIMTNKIRSVLYVGVTSNLRRRVKEHKNGQAISFTQKYNCKHLIYFEEYELVINAIEREKQLKNWKRAWKLELIRTVNPQIRDITHEI